MTQYVPTVWVNNVPPPLSAANLNKLTDELESQALARSISHSLPTWTDGASPAITDAAPLNEMERVIQAVATVLGLPYTPTVWQQGWAPARNATRLYNMENQARLNRVAIDTPANPPLPASWGPPVTISTGGMHIVAAQSTSSTPAVQIATSLPVTITGHIKNTAGGTLIQADQAGCQVTVDHVFAYGGTTYATSNRFIRAVNYKSLTVSNCTIEAGNGIQLDLPQASSTVLITKNRHHNIQGGIFNNGQLPGNFIQFRDIQNSTSEVSWNEIFNEYNLSAPTDLVSMISSRNINLHDNMFFGQYEPGNTDGVYSQNGLTIEGGSPAPTNIQITNNQLIASHSIGVFQGSSITVTGNRVINDGKLPDGITVDRSGKYEPFWCAPGGTNNHFHGNVGAYISNNGNFEYGRFPGCPEGDLGERANNTYIGPPVTKAMEDAEMTTWLAKLASNGIVIGA